MKTLFKCTNVRTLPVILMLLFISVSWGQTVVSHTFSSTSGNIDANIAFTTAKESASSAPAFNDGLRLYYHSSGNGGSVTLTPKNDAIITSVKIYAQSGYTPAIKYNVNNGADLTAPLSGSIYTISGINAGIRLRFRNANTTNTQLRIDKIEVTYSMPVAAELELSQSSLTGFSYTENNGPSAIQTFQISGTNLNGTNVSITASNAYEISSNGTDFSGSVVLTAFNGTSTTIHTRLKSGLSIGSHTGNLTISGGGVTPNLQVDLSGQVTMNVPVMTIEIINGVFNESLNYNLIASNNPVSYQLVSGSQLPVGLTLDPNTGLISGTPQNAGTFTSEFTATNQGGISLPATYTFNIAKANQTLVLSDVLKTLSSVPFDLPANTNEGFAVQYSSGDEAVATISGNTVNITGLGTTTVTATQSGNANYNSFTQTFSLEVSTTPVPLPEVTSSVQTGTYQVPFTYTLQATNDAVSYAVETGSSLPQGLTLNTTTGVISGTPGEAGTFTTQVTATNETGPSAPATITFEISKAAQSATFEAISKTTQDIPFAITVINTDQGLPLTYTVADENVATVSGNTVTIVGAGNTTITATQTGNENYFSFSQDFDLSVIWVTPPPAIIEETTNGTVDGTFTYTINAINNPETFALATAAVLPEGLTLNATTGVINGVPVTAGTFTAAFTATNVTGTSPETTITFVIQKGIQTAALTDINKNTNDLPFNLPAKTNKQMDLTYAVADETVATISGTAVTIVGEGATVITATQAGNENYEAFSQDITLTVVWQIPAPVITAEQVPATAGTELTYTINAINNPVSYSIVNGNTLPAGLSLNTTTGIISGTPIAPGTYTTDVRATNSTGTSVPATLTFVIAPGIVVVDGCFNENFSEINSGNSTSSTGQTVVWNGNLHFPFTETAYQAGGAIKLGTGSVKGSVTSPPLNGVYGTVTVNFDVKGWSSIEGTMLVTLGQETKTVTYTARLTNPFESKSLVFENVADGSVIKFETSAKRAFLDNISVCNDVPDPVIVSSSTSLTGFAYVENNGPSAVQTVEVSGTDLNGSDVLITASTDYEVSTDGTSFANTASLVTYDGTATILYTRLKSGLTPNNYTGSLSIMGGGIPTAVEVALSGAVTEELNPSIMVSSTSLTGFAYVENNGPSAVQTVEVSGTDLNGTDVLVTASSDYEVSTDGTSFANTASLVTYNGTATTLYTRLKSGLTPNNYTGSLSITGGGIPTAVEVALSGTVTEELNPSIVVSSTSLTGFAYVENNGPSAVQTVEVSGTDLNGSDVLVTASSDYEVSTDGTTFTEMVGLVTFDGTATTLYTRLKSGLSAGNYNGTLSITGGGISTAVEVALSGTVTEELNPSIVVSSTSLTGFAYVENNGPSAVQTVMVSGTDLNGSDVLVTASSDYEVSADGTTFTEMVGLVTFDGTATTLYTRLKSGLTANIYNGTLSITGGGIPMAVEITLSGTVSEEMIIQNPEIVVSSTSLTGFTYVENNGPSAVQTVEVSGTDLNGSDVLVTASSDYEVSADGTTFTEMVGLVTFDGAATTLYTRLKSGLSAGDYNGTLSITGGGISAAVEVALSGTVTEEIIILNPEIVVSSTSLTGFAYVENNGPSAVLTVTVSGTDLNGSDVLVTASSDYEVSADGTTFTEMVGLVTFDGTATTLYTRLKSGLSAGNYNGTLSITGGGIPTAVEVALSGTVAVEVVPVITVSETEIVDLDYDVNQGPSEAQAIEVSGTDLDATAVVITASENFEVSLDNQVFTTTITLENAVTTPQTIYVRLMNGLVENTYEGTLTVSGGGATEVIVSLTGIVSPTATNPEFEKDVFTMYPNPATDVVMFNKNIDVEIYTLNGKKIISERNTNRVDVSHLEAGVYLVKTANGNIQKLVIK